MAPTYATAEDVKHRLPYRDIEESTDPSDATVEEWIEEGESLLTGALQAGQIVVPVTGATGISIMASWAATYAEARYRLALAATGGDGSNDDGEYQLERFEKLLENIEMKPSYYDSVLWGSSNSDNTRKMRGYVLDNSDSKSISGGDFTPKFTRGMKF